MSFKFASIDFAASKRLNERTKVATPLFASTCVGTSLRIPVVGSNEKPSLLAGLRLISRGPQYPE